MIIYKQEVGQVKLVYLPVPNNGVRKAKIKSAKDAADYFRFIYDAGTIELHEDFFLLLLNRANNTMGWAHISMGGKAGTVVDVDMIFRYAILSNASFIIISHNHPSGNVMPSEQDKNVTRRIADAGKILGIQLVDHIILTADSYYSFGEEGLI